MYPSDPSERLGWIKTHYAVIQGLARAGTWMQVTAGSLAGGLQDGPVPGRADVTRALYILATDAHDTRRRPLTSAEDMKLPPKGRRGRGPALGGDAAVGYSE